MVKFKTDSAGKFCYSAGKFCTCPQGICGCTDVLPSSFTVNVSGVVLLIGSFELFEFNGAHTVDRLTEPGGDCVWRKREGGRFGSGVNAYDVEQTVQVNVTAAGYRVFLTYWSYAVLAPGNGSKMFAEYMKTATSPRLCLPDFPVTTPFLDEYTVEQSPPYSQTPGNAKFDGTGATVSVAL